MRISLDYGDLSSAISNSRKLSDELDQYCNDLCNKFQKELYSVEGGSSEALDNADYYVRQKINKLRAKSQNAETISLKIDTLLKTAKRVDDNVKRTIEGNQKELFTKNPNLRPSDFQLGWTAFICDMKKVPVLGTLVTWMDDGASATSELLRQVKYWYHCEGGKELMDVVVAATLAVLSVVALVCAFAFTGGTIIAVIVGVAGVISALIGVVNAATNFITSIDAYNCAMRGEYGRSKFHSGQDTISDWLTTTDFDDKVLNRLSNVAAVAIEITDTICSLIQFADLAVTIKKSLNGRNLKQTFRAICQPRDRSGRFVSGKPSILNGLKTIKARFNWKDFLLGDLDPSKLKNIKITKLFKDKKAMKAIGTFAEAVGDLIKDVDNVRTGETNIGEMIAKRCLGGLDSTLFPDRYARVRGGQANASRKLLSDTSALKKLHGLVIDKSGLGKFIFSDVLNADFVSNIADLDGGIIGDVKGVLDINVKSTGMAYGIPDVNGINVKMVSVDKLFANKEIFSSAKAVMAVPKITVPPLNTSDLGVNKINMPSVSVGIQNNPAISTADLIPKIKVPSVVITGVQIPKFCVSIDQQKSGILPCFEFRSNLSALDSMYERQVPFTFLGSIQAAIVK